MKQKYPRACCSLVQPLAWARIEEEARRRKVDTDDVINDMLCDRAFRQEFSKVPTPHGLDVGDIEVFSGWMVSEFAMRFLPLSRRELQ